jgi:hypothetical protein
MKEAGHGSGGLAHDGDVVAVAAESRNVLLRVNVIRLFYYVVDAPEKLVSFQLLTLYSQVKCLEVIPEPRRLGYNSGATV